MLDEAHVFVTLVPFLVVPGIAIVVTGLSVILFGDAVGDFVDAHGGGRRGLG